MLTHLPPRNIAAPQIIDSFRATHPHVPIILYISGSGGLLERMAACNPDIISIDQSVDIVDGIKRVGDKFAVQGNMDPGVLFGSHKVGMIAKLFNFSCAGLT